MTGADGRYERPYGWAWALALVHEIASLDDVQARRWLTAIAPLADALTKGFLDWLPKATYPVRYGVHANSAFGLSVALPFAARQAQAGAGTGGGDRGQGARLVRATRTIRAGTSRPGTTSCPPR